MSSQSSETKSAYLDGDSSDGVHIAAPYDSDPDLLTDGGVLDDRAFDRELRKRNLPMLLWTAVVFNTA